MPLALERLAEDPLIEGDYYPGDLLYAVLRINPRFWRDRPDLRDAVGAIVRRALPLPRELEDDLATFDPSGATP